MFSDLDSQRATCHLTSIKSDLPSRNMVNPEVWLYINWNLLFSCGQRYFFLNEFPAYELSTKLVLWIANFLSECRIHVVVNAIASKNISWQCQLPWGICSTTKFILLHSNNLLSQLMQSTFNAEAVILISNPSSLTIPRCLNHGLKDS